MQAQCASLGETKEASDNAVGDLVKAAYGFSPTLSTCIYAGQYQFSAGTVGGTYFNLLTGNQLQLPEAGVWSISTYEIPANDFVYNGYVYSCNGSYTSTNNQNGQPDWTQLSDSNCGYLWIYTPSMTSESSIESTDSILHDYINDLQNFWNEYYQLVPQS